MGEAAGNAVEHAYRDVVDPGRVGVELLRTALATSSSGSSDSGRWRPPPADPASAVAGCRSSRSLARDVDLSAGRPTALTVRFRILQGGVEDAAVRRGTGTQVTGRPAVVRATSRPGGRCLELSGDLDLAGVTSVRDTLSRRGFAGHRPTTLDLTGLGHVSSIGLGLLREIAQRADDRGVPLEVLLPADGPARRAMDLTGVTDFLRASG